MDGTSGSGEIYLDYITVAGLTLWSTVIWADTNFYDGADGIIGVGFEGSLTAGSLIESMVQNSTMTAHSEGSLQFGALDANIVEELKYTDALVRHAHAWDTTGSINGIGPFDVLVRVIPRELRHYDLTEASFLIQHDRHWYYVCLSPYKDSGGTLQQARC